MPPRDPPELLVGVRLYIAVACLAGTLIALQIVIMRVFAAGSWSHFGSLVVSLAMLGFGVASVVVFLLRSWLDRHWQFAAGTTLVLVGPLAVAANQIAQLLPFNAIFLISDPAQKWRLLDNFLVYLLPFLAGALFLGIIFRQGRARFNRLYFADLVGSGGAGIIVLGAMYLLPPEELMIAPLVLWAAAVTLWFRDHLIGSLIGGALVAASYLALPGLLGLPAIAVSQYKGISYARNFPDARQLYRSVSPYGDLQVYASSYMHFAPGLSDNAAFNVPELPPDSYVGMYIDGEGPVGIMRPLPPSDSAYFHYLPMNYPYLLKTRPKTFCVQFGGGLSTMTALVAGSSSVTIAESNPEVLRALRSSALKDATGGLLSDPRVRVIGYDGRLFLAHTSERFDVIDLSLADSVGLSNPGGFAITEKYAYTEQALTSYMRALAPGGILSVTIWNKEEPPKSVIKFYATVAAAVRVAGGDPERSIFVAQSYLSTTTVLYKNGWFRPDEVALLRKQTAALSFDEIYSPGYSFDPTVSDGILARYRESVFGAGPPPQAGASDAGQGDTARPDASAAAPPPEDGADATVPSTTLARLVWHSLARGKGTDATLAYVFDTRPLSDDRPYFAGYVRPADLPKTLDRLEIMQDDWGYLLLWATLGIAILTAGLLILLPVLLGRHRGRDHVGQRFSTLVFFGCLGLGYISVEVGLISWFTRALINPTIAAAVTLSGMLVFSGLGSLAAERAVARARVVLPLVLIGIAGLLGAMTFVLPHLLDQIGDWSIQARIAACLALLAPTSFLMGFPMAAAMTTLARSDRDQAFVWAWGINGCFSVIGAAAVPLVAVTFGLSAVLDASAAAYLLALPAFLALIIPLEEQRA